MPIPNMPKPNGDFDTFTLTYKDRTSRVVYVTDKELSLDSNIIFSSTDLKGNITKMNEAFIRFSGWEEGDLIGTNQYILRHPDMPAVIFYDAWTSLKEKGRWHGYIKNLCRDGRYYWAYTMINATKRDGRVIGYQCSRHKISDDNKQRYEDSYAKLSSYKTLVEQVEAFSTESQNLQSSQSRLVCKL